MNNSNFINEFHKVFYNHETQDQNQRNYKTSSPSKNATEIRLLGIILTWSSLYRGYCWGKDAKSGWPGNEQDIVTDESTIKQ